jgi:acyl carrier protein
MGLDFLDLIYTLEKEYNIRVDLKQEIGPVFHEITVRGLVDLVERKIREKPTEELTAEDYPQKVFAETFGILASYAENPFVRVTPETRLTELFWSLKQRNFAGWTKMMNTKSPETDEIKEAVRERIVLKIPRRTRLFLIAGGIICFMLPGIIMCYHSRFQWWLCAYISSFAVYSSFVYGMVFRPMFRHRRFPPDGITVGDVAEKITAKRRRGLHTDGSIPARVAVEIRVMEILADITAAKPENISLDTRLVDDLNMG